MSYFTRAGIVITLTCLFSLIAHPTYANRYISATDQSMNRNFFIGDPRIWYSSNLDGHVGHIFSIDRRTNLRKRLDLYRDGGRFILTEICPDSRQRKRQAAIYLLKVSGGQALGYDCAGQFSAYRRKEIARAILAAVEPPVKIENMEVVSYLMELRAEMRPRN